jgi:hypothetical protein
MPRIIATAVGQNGLTGVFPLLAKESGKKMGAKFLNRRSTLSLPKTCEMLPNISMQNSKKQLPENYPFRIRLSDLWKPASAKWFR